MLTIKTRLGSEIGLQITDFQKACSASWQFWSRPLAISGQCKAKPGKHRGSGTISSGYQDLQRVSPDAVGKVHLVQSSCSIKGSPQHVTQDCIKMAFEHP